MVSTNAGTFFPPDPVRGGPVCTAREQLGRVITSGVITERVLWRPSAEVENWT